MDKHTFMNDLSERLSDAFSLYEPSDNELKISATLKRQSDSMLLNYYVMLFFDFGDEKVFGYEEAFAGEEKLSDTPEFKELLVQTNNNDSPIPVSSIMQSIIELANEKNIDFVQLEEKPHIKEVFKTPNNDVNAKPVQQKASKPLDGSRNNFINRLPIVLIAVVVLIALIFVLKLLVFPTANPNESPVGTNDSGILPTNTPMSGGHDSSTISDGVVDGDFGNLANNPFYFATKDNVFYSCMDTEEVAHIYKADRDGKNPVSVFNGFGWSLVVYDGWLYFSGNEGTQIDGSYNIYRMRTDGTDIQKIVSSYSYNMFFYGDNLFYLKQNPAYSSLYSLCKASLDGSNETEITNDAKYPVIYMGNLYYADGIGNMYKRLPDGSNPEVLLQAEVEMFVLSDDKLLYIDKLGNIKSYDLDTKATNTTRLQSDKKIYTLNTYNGELFFVEYDSDDFDYATYAWKYTVKSIGFDGSGEKEIFSSESYGFYMNIIDGRVMLFDYVLAKTGTNMVGVIKSINPDGSDLKVINR